jgi:hypothetical protein
VPITVNYVSSNHALARLSVLLVGGGEGDYPDKPTVVASRFAAHSSGVGNTSDTTPFL